MTISYTLDVSQTNTKSFLRLLLRWRGSIWKAVLYQLAGWLVCYLIVSAVYRLLMPDSVAHVFEHLAKYLNAGLDTYIPLTFMLGFFVSFVVGRWGHILDGMGWIDNSAIAFSTFIRGNDDSTRALRRTLVRYMVLNQALVLRDISMQVRKRFPALETLEAAGFCTHEELIILEKCHDQYSRYWIPIHWCYEHLYEARQYGKISSDFLLDKITLEIQAFRQGLAKLLKYDWVPIPLIYPQVILLSVRMYFFICLISRQFLKDSEHQLWIPIATMIQFIVYMGWLKVAEALLNPLGEDDDDLECNYVIDKNLITGLTLVDQGGHKAPLIRKDQFWDNDHIAPLYSLEAAERTVHPLIGSASKVNLVKNVQKITMTPHKDKLAKLTEEEQHRQMKIVDITDHNLKHSQQRKLSKETDADRTLSQIRRRSRAASGNLENVTVVATTPRNRSEGRIHERHDRISPRDYDPPHYSPKLTQADFSRGHERF
jgi:predicted membrane chloride channel (bestrophin family)